MRTVFFEYKWYPVLAIALINILLRSINLGDSGLWYDETFTVFHAQQEISHVLEIGQIDTNPPLYNILVSMFIWLFGDSEFSVRFFSVLIASVLGSFLYYSIRKHFNWKAALVVSVLYLCSDFILLYSQETRCYILLTLVTAISIHLHLNFYSKPSWRYGALIGIFVALGMYTHYAFIMLSFSLALFTILNFIRNKKVLLIYAGGLMLSIALFSIWIPYIIKGYENTSNGEFWLKYHGFSDVLIPLKEIFFGDFWYLGVSSFFVLSVFFWLFNKRNSGVSKKVLLLITCSLLPPVLSGVISFGTPIYLPRYLIPSVLSFIILFGVLVVHTKPRVVSFMLLGAIIITQLTIWTPGRKKQMVREAVSFLQELRGENDLIFVQTPSVIITFAYYYDREWFRNYNDFSSYSSENNICIIGTGQNFNPEHCKTFDRILLFQAYARLEDPKGTLVNQLNQHFTFQQDSAFINVSVKVFENKNLDTTKVYDLVISDSTVTYGGQTISSERIGLKVEQLPSNRAFHINNEHPTTTQKYDVSFKNIKVFANTYFSSEIDINPSDEGNLIDFITHAKDSVGKNLGWFSMTSNKWGDFNNQWKHSSRSCQIKYPNLMNLDNMRFYAQPLMHHDVLLRDYKITIHNVQLVD